MNPCFDIIATAATRSGARPTDSDVDSETLRSIHARSCTASPAAAAFMTALGRLPSCIVLDVRGALILACFPELLRPSSKQPQNPTGMTCLHM
jgi:hypothetical protein